MHEYKVEPEYRTKADAKAAVACLAAEKGVFELLRFRGEPPPADYQSFWEVHNHNKPAVMEPKRKEPDDKDDVSTGGKNKRQRIDPPGGQEGELPSYFALDAMLFTHPSVVVNNGNEKSTKKGFRKKHSASGSSGLVSLGRSAQPGSSKDPNHHGNRSASNSMTPFGGSHYHMARPSALFSPLYAPVPANGRTSSGSGPYHFQSHVTTPFQQQNPFTPTQSVGGALYPAPPYGPSSSKSFQGRSVIPPPVPFDTYPRYATHRLPWSDSHG